jgi:hypothetical protein
VRQRLGPLTLRSLLTRTKRGHRGIALHAREEFSARNSHAPFTSSFHAIAYSSSTHRPPAPVPTRSHAITATRIRTRLHDHSLDCIKLAQTCRFRRWRNQHTRWTSTTAGTSLAANVSAMCRRRQTPPQKGRSRGARWLDRGDRRAFAAASRARKSVPPHVRARDLAARRQSGALKRDCAGVLCSTAQSICAGVLCSTAQSICAGVLCSTAQSICAVLHRSLALEYRSKPLCVKGLDSLRFGARVIRPVARRGAWS